ncbi:MAG: associated Golgi protein-like protein [Candidatus Saccharibacteria bacterium]|nr:associated Golgi protein-like protein [Candidatus Saccharibacteria bacterium]
MLLAVYLAYDFVMIDSIYTVVASSRYISIFILMALLPTEAVMPVAGYLASAGQVSLVLAIIVGAAGSTLGSIVIYLIARLVDQAAVYRLIHKRGKWIGLRPKNIERAGRWFDRHASTAVLVGRFVPGLRTAVSLSDVFPQMALMPFVSYTTIGNSIPAAILAYVGYVAGENSEIISLAITSISSLLGWSLLVLGFGYLLLYKSRH